MADLFTFCTALLTLCGFLALFLFVRRLGILELEAALINDDYQRPKMDPQPMVEVKNPFEIAVSSLNNCYVKLVLSCREMCKLNCYWKVKKEILEKKVLESQSEQDNSHEENHLYNLQTLIQNNSKTLLHSELIDACSEKTIVHNIEEVSQNSSGKVDLFIADPMTYDLVVHMEITKENERLSQGNPCNISAMLVGVHLKKEEQHFKPQIVQQYIQSRNGKLFKMKKLFLEGEQSSPMEEDNNLCIVCQIMPISRALIPCGHACLCVLCFDKMNSCPMCRQHITSSFILREEPNIRDNDDTRFSDILKRMNPLEIIRGIYNAT